MLLISLYQTNGNVQPNQLSKSLDYNQYVLINETPSNRFSSQIDTQYMY